MGSFDDANVDKDLLNQIFADEGEDMETDALLDEMSKTLDGYGFQDLVKFDTDKYQIELDAKNAVAAK